MRNAKVNGSDTKIKMIMAIANLVSKMKKNKEKGLEKGNNFHFNFECKGCKEKFVLKNNEYCNLRHCKRCYDNLNDE